MTEDPRLNATSAALLGLLHDGPLTGWELIGRAQERIGEFWSLTPSQVYRELTGMADRGLVSAGTPGPRDRKPYEITDAGREALAGWLTEDATPSYELRHEGMLKLFFADAGSLDQLTATLAAIEREAAERIAASVPTRISRVRARVTAV